MQIKVHNVEYSLDNYKPIIHLFGRDQTGERVRHDVKGFRPYFFVKTSETVPRDRKILNVEHGYTSLYGDSLKKVIVHIPKNVSEIKEQYFSSSFESDILFQKRFMLDKNIYSGYDTETNAGTDVDFGEARILFLDIECDGKIDFSKIEQAEKEITCISCFDSHSKRYFTFIWRDDFPIGETKKEMRKYKNRIDGKEYDHVVFFTWSENVMLHKFYDFINACNPDIVTGWNVNNFDLRYLFHRCYINGPSCASFSAMSPLDSAYVRGEDRPEVVIKGRTVFDLLSAYRKMQKSEIENYRLESVAQHELGIGKHETAYDLWQSDIEKLIEYNVGDVELCVEIENKVNVINYYEDIRVVTGCLLSDTLANTKVIDMFLLHYAKQKGIVLPSKSRVEHTTYEGALVAETVPGIYSNVISVDLKSLYPNIIRSANMSPECLDGDIKLGNGISFKKYPIGLIPEVIVRLFAERDKYKKLMEENFNTDLYDLYFTKQFSYKSLINTFYGYLGYPNSRLYNRDVAASITWMGREIITHTVKKIESLGYRVVLSDTDSCYFEVGEGKSLEELIDIGNNMVKLLNEEYSKFVSTFGIEQHYFQIEFEKIFSRLLFVESKKGEKGAKKRYAGRTIYQDGKKCNKLTIMGFDAVRSDCAKISKEIQKKVLTKVLDYADRKELRKYIRSIIIDIKNSKIDADELGMPSSFSKPVEDYRGAYRSQPHIRGVEFANKYLNFGIYPGTKPKLLYLKDTGKYPCEIKKNMKPSICYEDDYQLNTILNTFNLDYDTMIEKLIKMKIENIIKLVNATWDDVAGEMLQRRLI